MPDGNSQKEKQNSHSHWQFCVCVFPLTYKMAYIVKFGENKGKLAYSYAVDRGFFEVFWKGNYIFSVLNFFGLEILLLSIYFQEILSQMSHDIFKATHNFIVCVSVNPETLK